MARQYGDWEVQESLGAGGQAEVYRVRQISTGEAGFVLKRLRNELRQPRFRAEFEALTRIDHPRIPKLVDFNLDDPAWLVYREVEGTTLDKLAALGLSVDEAIDLCRDVVEAAAAAHSAGVVHRDIKPNNVVVTNESPHRRAWLIDFGICQHLDSEFVLTTTGEAIGNSAFAPPEAAAGSAEGTGPASDVYSLGKLLYYAVTSGGVIAREAITPAVLDRIPTPRSVERSYIRQLLEATVCQNASSRISAVELQSRLERYGALMRLPVNRMGTRGQTCPICREGMLLPVTDTHEAKMMGFERFNDPNDYRLLHCEFCGWVQGHFIKGTRGRAEWEW